MKDRYRWIPGREQIDAPPWFIDALTSDELRIENGGSRDMHISIPTPAGAVRADMGDWIVRDKSGGFLAVRGDA